MSSNPDLNKQAQKVIFSRKITNFFDSQICFNNVSICRNLFGLEIEFPVSYLVRNVQPNARNRYN